MHTHHVFGIAFVIAAGIAAKLVFFPVSTAEAGVKVSAFDVSRMHENKALPEQAVRDMSFVYAD